MAEQMKSVYEGEKSWLNADLPLTVWRVGEKHEVTSHELVYAMQGGPKLEDGTYSARWFVDSEGKEHLPDYDTLYDTKELAKLMALQDLDEKEADLRQWLTVLEERRQALAKV